VTSAILLVSAVALITIAVAVRRLVTNSERTRVDSTVQQMLSVFGAAAVAVEKDPAQLLVWYPYARNARLMFPEAFARLDSAFGRSFPFSKEHVQVAHARCSSEWLAWERAHDAEYSLQTAQVEDEIARSGSPASALLRTRLAAIEQRKLERYQQRYEEYIKTAKALAAFAE